MTVKRERIQRNLVSALGPLLRVTYEMFMLEDSENSMLDDASGNSIDSPVSGYNLGG